MIRVEGLPAVSMAGYVLRGTSERLARRLPAVFVAGQYGGIIILGGTSVMLLTVLLIIKNSQEMLMRLKILLN